MHEVGEESRRRSYATMILTVDATLNMYTPRAENPVIRDCPKTRASGSYALDAAPERFPSRTPCKLPRRTIFYSRKKETFAK